MDQANREPPLSESRIGDRLAQPRKQFTPLNPTTVGAAHFLVAIRMLWGGRIANDA
jgi:hypothetical protein